MPLEHPAISAWRELQPDYLDPALEVFEVENRCTTVCRLMGAGRASTDVIAKRSRRQTAGIERLIYEEILPNLPFPMLHYYGFVEEPDGEFWWLFIEDLSDQDMYLPHIEEHRVAAARWLGAMNTTASSLAAAARLPERGPGHYLNLLHSARNTISINSSNPALQADDLVSLESVLAQCEHLSAHWSQLESVCQGVPDTLVHGDFITKNVRIRKGQDGIILLPFDWEKAGWGSPAEDISRVDLMTYWSTIHDHWPRMTVQKIQRLMSVGKVFRCLVYLDWIAPNLAAGPVEGPISEIKRCEAWLADLIQTAPWRD